MDIELFKKRPILGILRGIESAQIEPLIETIIQSELQTIEITLNTPGAIDLIKRAVHFSKKRLTIGAGTVLDLKNLKMALDAGASFMVMPVLILELVEFCAHNKIPVFPGALTPQEIYNAWNAGASMVKVFPASFFGPKYFTEIKGPFNTIKLLACGGITPQNTKDYFDRGANAIAIGGSVFRKDWLIQKDYASIQNLIRQYTRLFPSPDDSRS